jgi:hypothetical protein
MQEARELLKTVNEHGEVSGIVLEYDGEVTMHGCMEDIIKALESQGYTPCRLAKIKSSILSTGRISTNDFLLASETQT